MAQDGLIEMQPLIVKIWCPHPHGVAQRPGITARKKKLPYSWLAAIFLAKQKNEKSSQSVPDLLAPVVGVSPLVPELLNPRRDTCPPPIPNIDILTTAQKRQ